MVVVRRCQKDHLVVQRVYILEQTYHHTLEFAQFMLVVAKFCDRVEFV